MAMISNKRLEVFYSPNYCLFLFVAVDVVVFPVVLRTRDLTVPHCNRQLILLLISLRGWGGEKVLSITGPARAAPLTFIYVNIKISFSLFRTASYSQEIKRGKIR